MNNEKIKDRLDIIWDEGRLTQESTTKLNEYLVLLSNFYIESRAVNTVDTIRVSIITSIIQQRYFSIIKKQNTIYAWTILLLVVIGTLVNLETVLRNTKFIWFWLER